MLTICASVLGMVQAGQMVKSVIERVQHRRERTVTISDPLTMAAVAAASVNRELLDQLTGATLRSVRNLFGRELPNWLGTDSRQVWAVTFEHETLGHPLIIFMSPSGLVLGHAVAVIRRRVAPGGEVS
jgi:hypothetical protein